MRCAVYARVSTCEQEPENQLQELRRYADARGWTATEYVDRGVSGSKDRRLALGPRETLADGLCEPGAAGLGGGAVKELEHCAEPLGAVLGPVSVTSPLAR